MLDQTVSARGVFLFSLFLLDSASAPRNSRSGSHHLADSCAKLKASNRGRGGWDRRDHNVVMIARRRALAARIGSLSCSALARLEHLFFHGLQVEGRALLHRGELDRGLSELLHLLLDVDEAPELVLEPVKILERSGHPRALERIQAQVHENGDVELDRAAKPAIRLIDEAVLEVVDAHRAERAFRKVEYLMTPRRPLAGEEIELVVAVEVDLVIPLAELLALLQFLDNAQVAGRGHERRKPVKPGDEPIFDLAGGHLPRPADDARYAEASLHHGPLGPRERSLAAIGPGEVLRAVVGGEDDDGVLLEPVVLELLHDRADDVVELGHSGFVDGPAVLWRAQLLVLFREMGYHVHPGRIQPEEERLAIAPGLVEKLERVLEDLVVHGLHAIRVQRTGVLDALPADLAPARLLRRVVHVGRPGVQHVPGADLVLQFRRIVGMGRILHREADKMSGTNGTRFSLKSLLLSVCAPPCAVP